MNIDHYVTVNFNAMIDIVDALGGIEVDLTEDELYWTNEYLSLIHIYVVLKEAVKNILKSVR